MRHGISGNRLGRNSSLRKATIRDLAKATLIQQRICTTQAKAKEARKLVDKLITMGKKDTLANKRRAFSILCNHKLVSDLFSKTAVRFKNRVGGYTRIIPLGNRRGDNAHLAFLELTEKEESIISKPKSTAAAKIGEPKLPSPKADVIETQAIAEKHEELKEHVSKKESLRAEHQKGILKQDTEKSGKKFSGIKKIFHRKTAGQ